MMAANTNMQSIQGT